MIVETYKFKDGAVLEIHTDEDPCNPREEWDNATKMVCFHKRYNLGDKHDLKESQFESWKWQEIHDYLKEEAVIILPLRLYDHSGISISTGKGYPFNDVWDSGQVGFVYIDQETLDREWDGDMEKAEKCLDAEVKVYDQYLRGAVYGFVLKAPPVECNHCHHQEVKNEDSCWRFYGHDIKENGILDHIPQKYQDELKKLL